MDDAGLEELVGGAAAGDDLAWQRLWMAVQPRLEGLVRKPGFLGPVGRREDDVRDIVVDVMARLRADGCRRLKIYLDARRDNPRMSFMPWLMVVTKRVGIDWLRRSPEYVDHRRDRERPQDGPAGEWLRLVTLPSESRLPGERPPLTAHGTAMQLLRHAEGVLPPEHRRALELWVEGLDHDEIASRVALGSAAEAERIVRAALERLRRHFRRDADLLRNR